MDSEIEDTLSRELEQIAGNLVVPPVPGLPVTTTRSRWHVAAPALVAAAVVITVLVTALTLLTTGGPDRGEPAPAEPPTTSTTTDDGSVSDAAPEAPVVVSGVLYVGGQQVPGRWTDVRGSGTHWMGQRADDSWWWGYDARPQRLEGTMYQPPVISPDAGYVGRVISDGGGAMLVGSDTEEGGEGFGGVDLPGAGLDPAVRAVAVTDDGLVVVAGTLFQRLWRPFVDEQTIDLAQTEPGQVVIGNTAAGLIVNAGDNAVDGTQGEPYLARLSEDGTLTRIAAVPTHDVLEASEQWLAHVPPGTVGGEASAARTLRVQHVDGTASSVLTPPAGWLFVAPGFRWESDDRLLALVVTEDGGDESLVRCRPDVASCVLVSLP
ncbi:MAG: hypothetical protein JWN84_1402 [Nocardioides sp.]|nr:hypothetical protein [Nocardioides sp.]